MIQNYLLKALFIFLPHFHINAVHVVDVEVKLSSSTVGNQATKKTCQLGTTSRSQNNKLNQPNKSQAKPTKTYRFSMVLVSVNQLLIGFNMFLIGFNRRRDSVGYQA